jgi:hypothetical protein
MVRRTKKVGTILTELRVAECQEFVMAIPDLNTVEKSSIDAGEKFVISLLVGTSVDTTLIYFILA